MTLVRNLVLATLAGLPLAVSAQTVTCESRNYQQSYCPVGQPIARAWVAEQRSRSACVEGQTWGYDRNGIWVNGGCEAVFAFESYVAPRPPVAVVPPAYGGGAPGGQVTCESRNYQQSFCPVGQPIGRVWVAEQKSRSPCIEGQTWGYDARGIWVTQGCEAVFAFSLAGGPPVYAPPVAPPPAAVARISCESRNYQQSYCPAGQPIGRAWVAEQRSASPCIEGQTWGYDRNGIWVTQGCEAAFAFQPGY
jgi:hypothetical protein